MQSFVFRGLTHRLITFFAAGVSTVAMVSAAQAASDKIAPEGELFDLDLAQAVSPVLSGVDAYRPNNTNGFFLKQQPNTVVAGPQTAPVETAQFFYDAPASTAPVQRQLQQVQQIQAPVQFQSTFAAPNFQVQQPQGLSIVAPQPQPQPQPFRYQDPCPQSGNVYPAAQSIVGQAGINVYSTRDGRGIFFEVPLSAINDGSGAAVGIAGGISQILNGEQALYAQVIGHTDKAAGRSDQVDINYSQALADYMGSLFVSNGVNPQQVQSVGFGHRLRSSIGANGRIEVRLVPSQNCPGFQGGQVTHAGGVVHSGGQVGYGPGAGFAAPQQTVGFGNGANSVQVAAPIGAAVQIQRTPSVNGPANGAVNGQFAAPAGFQTGGGSPVPNGFFQQQAPVQQFQQFQQPIPANFVVGQVPTGFAAPGQLDPYAAQFNAPLGFQTAAPQSAPSGLTPGALPLPSPQSIPAPGVLPTPVNGFPAPAQVVR